MTSTTDDTDNAGRRLAASLVDRISRTNPTTTFAVIPKGAAVSDGFRPFMFAELAKAVDYTAHWLQNTFGRPLWRETLSYMAANDVRYFVFVLACNKTGYQAFLPSARNSKEAFLHLLQVTQCRKFICSAEKRQKVLELSNFTEALQVSEIPSLDEMLSSEVVAYNYRNTYEEDKDKVSFVIHSSGTTGMLMDRKRLSVVQSIGY
jgi:acyl-CoA synthetase (AMP-forming)/AMP-acid ligase II